MTPTGPLSPVQGESAEDVRLRYIAVQLDTIQKGQENLSATVNGFQLQYTRSHEQLVGTVESTMKRVDKVEASIGAIFPVVSRTDTIQNRLNEQEKDLETEINDRECEAKELNKKIEKVADAVGEIKETIKPLVFVYRIFIWLSIALGGSVLTLIWAILTHRVDLVFH